MPKLTGSALIECDKLCCTVYCGAAPIAVATGASPEFAVLLALSASSVRLDQRQRLRLFTAVACGSAGLGSSSNVASRLVESPTSYSRVERIEAPM